MPYDLCLVRVGIIGSGKIGATLAQLLITAGHTVWIANSRGPLTLAGLAAALGERAHAATVEEAAARAEAVVIAIPFGAYRNLPVVALADKTVLDATNYVAERDGAVSELDDGTTTSTELLAAHLRGAQIVKAYNSIFWEHLRDDGRPSGSPQRRALPLAGDEPAAKAAVARLYDDTGFDAVDAGPLGAGRRFQRGTPPYVQRYTVEELQHALRWAD